MAENVDCLNAEEKDGFKMVSDSIPIFIMKENVIHSKKILR